MKLEMATDRLTSAPTGLRPNQSAAIAIGAIWLAYGCFGSVAPVAAQGAVAQQPPATAARPTPPPKQQTPPAKKSPGANEGAAGGSEASLRQRVEQLEEQLIDLQVVVGTVESLARGGSGASSSAAYRGGAPVSGGSGGADAGRIAALETQMQALTSQLEQLTGQIRAQQNAPPRGPSGPAPRAGGFGPATVVTPNDPIANIINTPDGRDNQAARAPAGPPPSSSSAASRQQYDQAYSLLLQQNYPSAEAGFTDFLQQFPGDELAPNAQFWLGETHFVRGQWDNAAASFLKVAQNYPRAEKAPDSLAKFAMAMERKGNRSGACRALQELNTRYPSPPAHVRSWETAERRRAGCG